MIKPAVERRSSDVLSTQLIDDGPVGHALSVHLRRAKLITRYDDRPIVAKFLKSRVWGKVLEERTLVFGGRLPASPHNTAWNRWKPLCQNQLDSSGRFATTPACDGRTDGQTNTRS